MKIIKDMTIDEVVRNYPESMTELAERNGYNSEALLSKSYSKYGFPVMCLLEDEIDHINIHS